MNRRVNPNMLTVSTTATKTQARDAPRRSPRNMDHGENSMSRTTPTENLRNRNQESGNHNVSSATRSFAAAARADGAVASKAKKLYHVKAIIGYRVDKFGKEMLHIQWFPWEECSSCSYTWEPRENIEATMRIDVEDFLRSIGVDPEDRPIQRKRPSPTNTSKSTLRKRRRHKSD